MKKAFDGKGEVLSGEAVVLDGRGEVGSVCVCVCVCMSVCVHMYVGKWKSYKFSIQCTHGDASHCMSAQ